MPEPTTQTTSVTPGANPPASDTIPKAQYEEATKKVADLEAQLKAAPKLEDVTKIQNELAAAKADHKKVSDELTSIKTKSIEEKKTVLKAKGLTDEELKDLSEKELGLLVNVAGKLKPAPDLGGGGGAGAHQIKGSPMELAQQAYTKK